MTVPQERYRALRWARDWLEDVVQDPFVPPHARTEAASLLATYPSDELLRTTISNHGILPKDCLEALSATSSWLFAFQHPTSSSTALLWVLRHMPTSDEIAFRAYMQDRRAVHGGWLILGEWLEPDEDYIKAFVTGWVDDSVVAGEIEWLDARESVIEEAAPLYLISSSTTGVNFQTLKLRQRVLCTVPRIWEERTQRWKHVKSCVTTRCVEVIDPISDSKAGPCA